MKSLIWAHMWLSLVVSGEAIGNNIFSAKMLRELCESNVNSSSWVACVGFMRGYMDGYVFGVVDVLNNTGVLERAKKTDVNPVTRYPTICFDPEVKADQLAEIYVKTMRKNPESLHEDAGFMFTSMLIAKYPCKK